MQLVVTTRMVGVMSTAPKPAVNRVREMDDVIGAFVTTMALGSGEITVDVGSRSNISPPCCCTMSRAPAKAPPPAVAATDKAAETKRLGGDLQIKADSAAHFVLDAADQSIRTLAEAPAQLAPPKSLPRTVTDMDPVRATAEETEETLAV
jgi:hypothetical protein